jgi:hypothetical protein
MKRIQLSALLISMLALSSRHAAGQSSGIERNRHRKTGRNGERISWNSRQQPRKKAIIIK